MNKIGVIHGRFQMLHNGHMEYLLAAKQRCEYLLIGICNPEKRLTKYSEENPHRSKDSENPLTYYERFQMVKGALLEAGIQREEFDIIPFPINYPDSLANYVPPNAVYYMTIYDEWSLKKRTMLEELGYNIEIMWERTVEEKVTSGSEVRHLIRNNANWKHLVPDYVYRYTIEHGIDKELQKNIR